MKIFELELDLKLTKFGRRFFQNMINTTPHYKRNARRYGR